MRPRRRRRDDQWLADIAEAAKYVDEFLHGHRLDSFLADAKTRSAVLQQLTVVGEAASQLSIEFRQRHSEIDWTSIIGFRNRAVHAYFTIDWSIVWDTATDDIPELMRRIVPIREREFGAEGTDANHKAN